MLGAVGMPVFAFSPELLQGFARLIGPTGGLPDGVSGCSLRNGLLGRARFRSPLRHVDSRDGVGLSIIFAGGVAWLWRLTGLETALATGLYPFIVVDVIKIVAAGLVLPTAWKFLR